MRHPIDVLVLSADGEPEFRTIDEGLDAIHGIVGEPIDSMSLPRGLAQAGFRAFVNDEALSNGMPPNRWAAHLGQWKLHGPVMLYRHYDTVFDPDGEQWDGQAMTTEEKLLLTAYFTRAPTDEAMRSVVQWRRWWQDNPSGARIVDMRDS
jgi:hypothetical protein